MKLYYLLVTSNNESQYNDYELELVPKLNESPMNSLIKSLIDDGLLMISKTSISNYELKRKEYWINEEKEDKLQLFDNLWIDSGIGIQAISGALFCLENPNPFILNDIFVILSKLNYAPLIGYKPNGSKLILSESNELYIESLSLTLLLDENEEEDNDENEEEDNDENEEEDNDNNVNSDKLKPIREVLIGNSRILKKSKHVQI